MPGLNLLMERPKMSLQMHENLKRYILRERKKKKEEDVANEQKMREELVNHNLISQFNTSRTSCFFLEKSRNEYTNTGTNKRTNKTN